MNTPASPTLQTSVPLAHQSLSATNRQATFLADAVRSGDLALDAPYQRGSVWTVEQRRNLIRSWLLGLPIPAIITNRRWEAFPGHPVDAPGDAVIDGKQRVETALAWVTDDLDVPASWFDPTWVEATHATGDGPYVYHRELTAAGRRLASNRFLIPVAEAHLPTIAAEAEVFGLVNGAGVPQTDEDLVRAAHIAAQ